MPPRAQRLYPRMMERPPEFRVNPAWPYWPTTIIMPRTEYCIYNQELKRWVVNRSYSQPCSITDGPFTMATWCYTTGSYVSKSFMAFGQYMLGEYSNDDYPKINWPEGYGRAQSYVWPLNSWFFYAAIFSIGIVRAWVSGKDVVNIQLLGGTYPSTISAGLGNLVVHDYSYTADYVSDSLIMSGSVNIDHLKSLADPSNVDLRIDGIPLILPPRRRLWPVAPVAEYIKRRQLGLRVGCREAVI